MDTHFRKRWQAAKAKAKAKGVKLPTKDLGGALDKFEDALYQVNLMTAALLGAKEVVNEKVWKEKTDALKAAFKLVDALATTYLHFILKEEGALKKSGAKGSPYEDHEPLREALFHIQKDIRWANSNCAAQYGKSEALFDKIDELVSQTNRTIPGLQARLREYSAGKAVWEKVLRELGPEVDRLEQAPDKARAKALSKQYPEAGLPAGLIDSAQGALTFIKNQREILEKYSTAEKLKPSLHMYDSLEKGFRASIDQNKPLVKPVEALYKRLEALRK